jgi:hypothetical protein
LGRIDVKMLYTIEILEKRSTESPYQIITNLKGLFNIAFILENTNRISQFKISCGALIICTPQEFGFGEFSKWVLNFDFEKADE